jgi:hypothetical protein
VNDTIPASEFHEIWWIYSPMVRQEWAGLRIAHFRKTMNGTLFCIIQGEIDQRRVGMRIWEDIERSELWYKVKQIPIPSLAEIAGSAMQLDGESD